MNIAVSTATELGGAGTGRPSDMPERTLITRRIERNAAAESRTADSFQYPRGERLVHFSNWQDTIDEAPDIRSLIRILELAGFGQTADRIFALSISDELLDEDEQPASLESARALALAARDLIGLGEPRIGLADNGVLEAEWQLDYDKHIAMRFADKARTSFALIGPAAAMPNRVRFNGSGTTSDMLAMIRNLGVHRWRPHER
jgi:hypothetical protein